MAALAAAAGAVYLYSKRDQRGLSGAWNEFYATGLAAAAVTIYVWN